MVSGPHGMTASAAARWARHSAALLAALMMLLFAGCMTGRPAPVSDRARPGKAPSAPAGKPGAAAAAAAETPVATPADASVVVTPLSPVSGPAYTVKQGDTLFSIARANNVAMRDLATWNEIEVPYAITIGQQLRLTPPGGMALAPPDGSGSKPPAAADGAPRSGDGKLKSQPLAQRVPYSEQAYAQMRAVPVPGKPDVKAEGKPEVAAETRTDAKPEAKPDKPRTDGEVNWAWPVQGKVIGTFNEGTNKGIAIAGKRGQAVHASAAGRVIFSGSGIRGLGNLVVIRHNKNYLSVYAHNDKLLVKQGQNVVRGQPIANMGSSDADKVKLHFEIRRQGKPVDPMKLLPEG